MSDNQRRVTQAFVTNQFHKLGAQQGPDNFKEEVVSIDTFITEPATVRMSMGLTINLGNYESARVDVAIVVPCYKEQVDDAYDYASSWVEKRVAEEAQQVKEFARERNYR